MSWQEDQERGWQYSQQLRREEEIRKENERIERHEKTMAGGLDGSPPPPLTVKPRRPAKPERFEKLRKTGSVVKNVIFVGVPLLILLFLLALWLIH